MAEGVMEGPLDAAREGDAERPDRLPGERPPGLLAGKGARILPIRQHPLLQIVDALHGLPARDHQDAGVEQMVERLLLRLPIPPLAGSPPGLRPRR